MGEKFVTFQCCGGILQPLTRADELAQFLRVKTLYTALRQKSSIGKLSLRQWQARGPPVKGGDLNRKIERKQIRFVTVCIASSTLALLVLTQTGRYRRGFAGAERQSAHRPQQTSAVLCTEQCRPGIHFHATQSTASPPPHFSSVNGLVGAA